MVKLKNYFLGEITMPFGKKLKELRLANNLSQAEFAKRIGIKQSAVTAYEKELKLPGSANLIKIAEVFNVSVDYLLGLTPEKRRNLGTSPTIDSIIHRPIIGGKPVSDEELKVFTEIMEKLIRITKQREAN